MGDRQTPTVSTISPPLQNTPTNTQLEILCPEK